MWPFDYLQIGKNSGQRGARGEKRYQTHLLKTDLGEVMDVSGSGMRVRAEWRMNLVVGATFRLKVRSPQCEIMTRCKVVRFARVREAGFRGVDICLTILDAEPGLRAALVHLAMFGFIPRSQPRDGRKPAPGGAARAAEPDYYDVLGVSADATSQEIRKAYHSRARPIHPDSAGSAANVEEFARLGEAYRVLRDSKRRFAYDQLRKCYGEAA